MKDNKNKKNIVGIVPKTQHQIVQKKRNNLYPKHTYC